MFGKVGGYESDRHTEKWKPKNRSIMNGGVNYQICISDGALWKPPGEEERKTGSQSKNDESNFLFPVKLGIQMTGYSLTFLGRVRMVSKW